MSSEIDKITTTVAATSLANAAPEKAPTYEELIDVLTRCNPFNFDEMVGFKEGGNSEKLKRTALLKMMLEMCLYIIDNAKKPNIEDKKEETIYIQNKKMVKDLTFNLFSVLENYSHKDNELKARLLGKLIQSMYGY